MVNLTDKETHLNRGGCKMDLAPLLIILMFVIVIGYYIYNKTKSKTQRVAMKVIYGDKQKKYKRTFKTKVVGVTFDNDDGSSRQMAIRNLHKGQKVHLIWNPHNEYSKHAILVCGVIIGNNVNLSTCIGHLKEDLGKDVIDWMNDETLNGLYAEVVDILGGTKQLPTLGCLIKICLY
jgi:hypothetical protein